jgi:IS30 family transposase
VPCGYRGHGPGASGATIAASSPQNTLDRRPAEVNDRAVPGHWEGDLIIGLNRSAIGTLVERRTRYTILLPLPRMDGFDTQARVKNGAPLAGRGARAVKDAIVEAVGFLPEKLRRTLTWDRGTEMALHAELTFKTGLTITSVTRTAHGNAERTRTPTACSVSTFLRN